MPSAFSVGSLRLRALRRRLTRALGFFQHTPAKTLHVFKTNFSRYGFNAMVCWPFCVLANLISIAHLASRPHRSPRKAQKALWLCLPQKGLSRWLTAASSSRLVLPLAHFSHAVLPMAHPHGSPVFIEAPFRSLTGSAAVQAFWLVPFLAVVGRCCKARASAPKIRVSAAKSTCSPA